MITVKQLLRGEGSHWVRKPSKDLSSIETLAWSAAAELASVAELMIEPEDLPRAWPDTWLVLWGLEAYFKELGHPLSQAHALTMLKVERVNWGLTASGDDTRPPLRGV